MKSKTKFRILDILAVSVILFLVVAVLAPNFADALQKAKQKRTSSDMRNLGSAWLGWLTDQVGAQSAGSGKYYRTDGHLPISADELAEILEPNYIQEMPRLDGWRNELQFTLNTDLKAKNVMAIFSPGRDGVYDVEPAPDSAFEVEGFDSIGYDEDVIWADGYFVRWPAASCR